MPIATINPATAETLQTFAALSDAQIDDKIAHAARTFQAYRRTPLADRAAWLLRTAEILETEQAAFGRLMTTEMGKLLRAGGEEAAKCAWGCRFYAEHAPRMLADEPAQSTATESFVRYQPHDRLVRRSGHPARVFGAASTVEPRGEGAARP